MAEFSLAAELNQAIGCQDDLEENHVIDNGYMYQDKHGIKYYHDFNSDSDEIICNDQEKVSRKNSKNSKYKVMDNTAHQVPLQEIFSQDDLELLEQVSLFISLQH